MSIQVACIDCRQTYDAMAHPGLVRCGSCEERVAPVWPSASRSVTVLDSPADAWA